MGDKHVGGLQLDSRGGGEGVKNNHSHYKHHLWRGKKDRSVAGWI